MKPKSDMKPKTQEDDYDSTDGEYTAAKTVSPVQSSVSPIVISTILVLVLTCPFLSSQCKHVVNMQRRSPLEAEEVFGEFEVDGHNAAVLFPSLVVSNVNARINPTRKIAHLVLDPSTDHFIPLTSRTPFL